MSKLVRLQAAGKVEMTHMLDAMGSNIVAGADTTAITLSAALYYIYRTPSALAALRREIDDHLPAPKASTPITFKTAQDMPYLQAVIQETLRIHPAVGYVMPRKVPKGGAQLAGRHFPKGVSLYA